MKYNEIKDYLKKNYNDENKKKQIKKTIIDNYLFSDYVIKNERRRIFNDIVVDAKLKKFEECETFVEKTLNLNSTVEQLLKRKDIGNFAILLKAKAHFELVNEWISLEILYGMELAKRNNQDFNKFDENVYNYSIKILVDYLKETKNCLNNINKIITPETKLIKL